MPFFSVTLKQGVNYTVRIADGVNGTAVSFITLNKADRIAAAQPETVGGGATMDFAQNFSAKIDRVILLLSPRVGGSVSLTVLDANNNPIAPTDTYNGDATVQFEVKAL
jgi:hypothetical protein